MSSINYHNRRFRSVSNSDNGEVSSDTLFEYQQEGSLVWATYQGGGIRFGTLIASVDAAGNLDMRYQHMNTAGELMTGVCQSRPEWLPDGRLRLHERWRWTSGDASEGESMIEEVRGT
ncbi:hypothetical protein SAMN05421823_105172 [Catalinimonas alkaloidigena]|uniref:N-acetylglutamate synthase n=1 Tax=Catalinimonas alkaloidigena TaxID=1075417 RepID=A0A1G9J1X3_9BACT|nr:n-acetylglutamate synthase [Catalinimonas alkaloidigena]SDL31276.1 hypothetical protein SAMN05421823_105172 [Catalinimonas alkaloidigena]